VCWRSGVWMPWRKGSSKLRHSAPGLERCRILYTFIPVLLPKTKCGLLCPHLDASGYGYLYDVSPQSIGTLPERLAESGNMITIHFRLRHLRGGRLICMAFELILQIGSRLETDLMLYCQVGFVFCPLYILGNLGRVSS